MVEIFFGLYISIVLLLKLKEGRLVQKWLGPLTRLGVLKVYSYWIKSFHSVIKINSIDKIVKPQRVIRTKAGKKNQVSILFTPCRRTELISENNKYLTQPSLKAEQHDPSRTQGLH